MPQSKKQRVSAEVPAASAWPHAPSSSSNCIDHIHPALPEAPDPSNGASAPSKRPQLTPTEKLAVLDWYHAHGRNQKAAATHFQRLPRYNKLNQGTISRWLKREEKIRDNSSSPSDSVTAGACRRSAATREKSLKHPELEKCLSRWLEQLDAPQRARLSGREIKSVARQIYDELEVPETDRLELSNGWLGRFQTRHGLKLQRRHGEMLAKEEVDAEGERERLRDEMVTLGQALQALSLEAGSHHVAMSCMGAKEFVLLGLEEGKCNDLSVKELVQLVVGQEDKVQRSGPAKDAPSPLPENNLVEESYPTTQEDNSRKEDTSSSSHIDVSPEVVLHAQLTLEQYWTQKNFSLSPSILQVLQLTRAQLLHTSMAATASSPP
ncbi:hypothetical protein PHYPSEUDO_009629 [Phytophthora pseudosyringae]|uniref:HTH CENPB-type domain-containing protein n=1 Tax=Phytophthora pseudosyringae TaxID=221518 RepID=A0A8T1WJL0_9STRA|nr:hypothetical protein PHYPSEUDO_009629 [Phytophthora pseudosyringae]